MKRKIILTIMLTFTLTFTFPIGNLIVHAAPLEDCDLDGYDDSTGVPVPWPGYDETKGDTPAGPGGSTTTTPTGTGSTTNNSTGVNASSLSSDTNITNETSISVYNNAGSDTNKITNIIEPSTEYETEAKAVHTSNETNVLYNGEESENQKLEVKPKPVNSFWDALTVGLTSDNKGLIPGAIILLALTLTGGIAIAFSSFVKRRKNISK